MTGGGVHVKSIAVLVLRGILINLFGELGLYCWFGIDSGVRVRLMTIGRLNWGCRSVKSNCDVSGYPQSCQAIKLFASDRDIREELLKRVVFLLGREGMLSEKF